MDLDGAPEQRLQAEIRGRKPKPRGKMPMCYKIINYLSEIDCSYSVTIEKVVIRSNSANAWFLAHFVNLVIPILLIIAFFVL